MAMTFAYRGTIGCAKDDRKDYAHLLKIGRMSHVDYNKAIHEISLDEKDAEPLAEAVLLAELINDDVADPEDILRWQELEPEILARLDPERLAQLRAILNK
jgi:hypothetical protein